MALAEFSSQLAGGWRLCESKTQRYNTQKQHFVACLARKKNGGRYIQQKKWK
jgi:hypothetical protein